ETWTNRTKIFEHLNALKIPFKILVDGSFMTKKIDTDDVDFVIDLPVAISDNPTPAQERFLNQLAGHAFCRMEKMHSFLMFDAPVMHAQYALSQALHAQWERDFGFSYVSKEPKGIAVLVVQP